MQTILGSNGIIGQELAKALPQYTNNIRLVSRNPAAMNIADQLVVADLTSADQTDHAVRGSSIVYLTAGLEYKTKVWQEQWPLIMKNVINACKKHDARLVFFDNVYLYGRVRGWMTEDTAINPQSKKGAVRARIAEMLMDEIEKGLLTGLIARSADFYGLTDKSLLSPMVFSKLAAEKKAQWLVNEQVPHSFTHVSDAGNATAMLGNTENAYNQVWHVPTDKNALTGEAFIQRTANAFHVPAKYMVLKKWMLVMAGCFNKFINESIEMLYQYEYEYLFDSSKFTTRFDYKPITYKEGIIQTAQSWKQFQQKASQ